MKKAGFILACLSVLLAPTAEADVVCGEIVVGHLKLSHDLACAGAGLIVGADGIMIDLNGFTIVGTGTGAGIEVTGRQNVAIIGGTIRNFEAGVRTRDSSRIVIAQNEFVDNVDGIDLNQNSTGNTVKENQFRNNRSRGIMIRSFSTRHTIAENAFVGDRVGILVFGGVDNLIEHNVVFASTLAAIRINVLATGNRLRMNALLSSPSGVEFLVTPTGSATGNSVTRNTIALDVCGLKGPVAGNTVAPNLFAENDADTCP